MFNLSFSFLLYESILEEALPGWYHIACDLSVEVEIHAVDLSLIHFVLLCVSLQQILQIFPLKLKKRGRRILRFWLIFLSLQCACVQTDHIERVNSLFDLDIGRSGCNGPALPPTGDRCASSESFFELASY